MLIGLTYDLREEYRVLGLSEEQLAEFDSAETIAQLQATLERLGHRVERIGNVRRLAERLVAGDRWDLVFNICEGIAGRAREAQVPALLEAFGQPYTFADPLVMAATLDKAVAKRLVRDHGLATAPFAVVARPSDVAAVDLPFPLFVKPIAEGTGKGVSPASLVRSRKELKRACAVLLLRFAQPVLVETYLPGREFTVGIVGTGPRARVLGTLEIELLPGAEPGVYSFANKERCEELVRYVLVDDAEAKAAAELALACYRALECRDAGRVDLRSDASGKPQFLEVNPLAGLHPTHSDLPILAQKVGLGYDGLIGAIVESAAERVGLARAGLRRAGR